MRMSDWSSDVCSSDLTADVEGAHGELGAGLADRLRGDHADRLADVHLGAAGEIAPVAGAAHAAHRFAHQRGADEDRVDAGALDVVDLLFRDQRAAFDDDVDRKSTRLNSSHYCAYRMPSSAFKKQKYTKL